MISDKKKLAFIIIFIIFILFYLINLLISYSQNKIISFLNSNYFNEFLINIIDDALERVSSGELSQEKIEFYKDKIEKINNKYKPIFK